MGERLLHIPVDSDHRAPVIITRMRNCMGIDVEKKTHTMVSLCQSDSEYV